MHDALVTIEELGRDHTTYVAVNGGGGPSEFGVALSRILREQCHHGNGVLGPKISGGLFSMPLQFSGLRLLPERTCGFEFNYDVHIPAEGYTGITVEARRHGDILFKGTLDEFSARFDPTFVLPVPKSPPTERSELASLLGPVPQFVPRMRKAVEAALSLTSHHVVTTLEDSPQGLLLEIQWQAWPGPITCLTLAPAPLLALGFVDLLFTERRCTARFPQSVPAWRGSDLGFIEVGTSRRRGGSISVVKGDRHLVRAYGDSPGQLVAEDKMNFMTEGTPLSTLQRIVEHHVYGI